MKLSKKTSKKPAENSANASYSKVSFCFANEKLKTIKTILLFLRVRIKLIMQTKGQCRRHEPNRFTRSIPTSHTAYMKKCRSTKSRVNI